MNTNGMEYMGFDEAVNNVVVPLANEIGNHVLNIASQSVFNGASAEMVDQRLSSANRAPRTYNQSIRSFATKLVSAERGVFVDSDVITLDNHTSLSLQGQIIVGEDDINYQIFPSLNGKTSLNSTILTIPLSALSNF